ncbi:hypothetical protein DLNHIDIE_02211 [Acidithiobacillus thiooxidans ATCC 19377]|jgi:hypothetical protein|uniref:Uncharacterized protein n=1 Tax=Acidithiobacillus thiooxidans ATCC 19377 TaxID=637390 RepID=A0A543Q7P2_ACITH|nr:hypothetical protein DLNHIDIE_02211 [Acidithiobacillus thiooxidans ATCC 19377]
MEIERITKGIIGIHPVLYYLLKLDFLYAG